MVSLKNKVILGLAGGIVALVAGFGINELYSRRDGVRQEYFDACLPLCETNEDCEHGYVIESKRCFHVKRGPSSCNYDFTVHFREYPGSPQNVSIFEYFDDCSQGFDPSCAMATDRVKFRGEELVLYNDFFEKRSELVGAEFVNACGHRTRRRTEEAYYPPM